MKRRLEPTKDEVQPSKRDSVKESCASFEAKSLVHRLCLFRASRSYFAACFAEGGTSRKIKRSEPLSSGMSGAPLRLVDFEVAYGKTNSVVAKLFCVDLEEDADFAPKRVEPSWITETLVGAVLNRSVLQRNTPHVGMQIAACQGVRPSRRLGKLMELDLSKCCPENQDLAAGVVYESIEAPYCDLRPDETCARLANGFHRWMDKLGGDPEAAADKVLAATFRTLFTLMMLNRLGLRHNDPHLGNVLMGPASRGNTGRWAYFPDHAGILLLASPGADSDVDRWLQICPYSGFERMAHAPPGWVVSHLRRVYRVAIQLKQKGEIRDPSKVAKAAFDFHAHLLKSQPANDLASIRSALNFAASKLIRLGVWGCSWFLIRDDADAAWPYMVDWDWSSKPQGELRVETNSRGKDSFVARHNGMKNPKKDDAFMNENLLTFLPAPNNAFTLDTKGDAFVFASSAWPFANRKRDSTGSKLKLLLEEMAPRVDFPNGGRGPVNVLERSHSETDSQMEPLSPADIWAHPNVGLQSNRFCPGPIEFFEREGRCATGVRTVRDETGEGPAGCFDAETDEYGMWTLPDCAFKRVETLFEKSTVLEGSSKSAIQRFRVRSDFSNEVSPPIEVDGVFGDWMKRRIANIEQICKHVGLKNADSAEDFTEYDPFFMRERS